MCYNCLLLQVGEAITGEAQETNDGATAANAAAEGDVHTARPVPARAVDAQVDAQGAIRAPFNGADPDAGGLTRATVVPKDASGRCEEPALVTDAAGVAADTRGAVAATAAKVVGAATRPAVSERGECSGPEHDTAEDGAEEMANAWHGAARYAARGCTPHARPGVMTLNKTATCML